jgi:glycogen debranching enzyme
MDDLAGATVADPEPAVLSSEAAQLLSLKDGDSFLVADAWGDIRGGADGLFHRDTRILSRFCLQVGDKRPARLGYALSRDNAAFTMNGANRQLPPLGGRATPRGVIHVERKRCLNDGRLFERVRLTNFGLDEVMAPISIAYGADFADIFEVRGLSRLARGMAAEPRFTGRGVVLDYDGLDGVRRCSVIAFSEPPWRMTATLAEFMFGLPPGARTDLYIEVGPTDGAAPDCPRFEAALAAAHKGVEALEYEGGSVTSSDGAFAAWLTQSRVDVAVLTTRLATGPYPYAGIPWFSTPFGRDGIFTAWQLLWLDPSLARGVLAYLAMRQATYVSAFEDAAPGKILHETRHGEMAAMKEIPFGQYYGGVDTTPLFVALAGAYLERTADIEFIRALWPRLLAAAGWMERNADANGDGLIAYARGERTGLSNQGWKDSADSVFHEDGRLASGPIALVEVQGYAFAAWRAMAAMSERLGLPDDGDWTRRAEAIRLAVETRFWMADKGFYALAIDGDGAPCRVEASNPGHLLFVGLPSAERAAKVTARLLSPDFDSGWGLRTVAVGARRFNPMSYHNGSIWPHDTAIALAGMARYGERRGVTDVMDDMFEASKCFGHRMPELICGFPREANDPPIAYPAACMPQAWAAGSTFMMLQASLGLTIDAARREVRLTRPTLPEGVDQLRLTGLPVGGAIIDIDVRRLGAGVAVMLAKGSDRSVTVISED